MDIILQCYWIAGEGCEFQRHYIDAILQWICRRAMSTKSHALIPRGRREEREEKYAISLIGVLCLFVIVVYNCWVLLSSFWWFLSLPLVVKSSEFSALRRQAFWRYYIALLIQCIELKQTECLGNCYQYSIGKFFHFRLSIFEVFLVWIQERALALQYMTLMQLEFHWNLLKLSRLLRFITNFHLHILNFGV
jgi:hypothetical protein